MMEVVKKKHAVKWDVDGKLIPFGSVTQPAFVAFVKEREFPGAKEISLQYDTRTRSWGLSEDDHKQRMILNTHCHKILTYMLLHQ